MPATVEIDGQVYFVNSGGSKYKAKVDKPVADMVERLIRDGYSYNKILAELKSKGIPFSTHKISAVIKMRGLQEIVNKRKNSYLAVSRDVAIKLHQIMVENNIGLAKALRVLYPDKKFNKTEQNRYRGAVKRYLDSITVAKITASNKERVVKRPKDGRSEACAQITYCLMDKCWRYKDCPVSAYNVNRK